MNLTLNTYTQWFWKIDLHNLLGFVQLRADQHAQFEIREYANKIIDVLKVWVPSAYDAFEEYRLHAVTLSKTEISIVRDLLNGKDVSESRAALSRREWDSLAKVFDLKVK